jgi:hypothetical protein
MIILRHSNSGSQVLKIEFISLTSATYLVINSVSLHGSTTHVSANLTLFSQNEVNMKLTAYRKSALNKLSRLFITFIVPHRFNESVVKNLIIF